MNYHFPMKISKASGSPASGSGHMQHTLAAYLEVCAAAQEIAEKAPQLPQDIKWHFIGHLQSNKAKAVVGMHVCMRISTAAFEQISATVYMPDSVIQANAWLVCRCCAKSGGSRDSRQCQSKCYCCLLTVQVWFTVQHIMHSFPTPF